MPIPSSSILKVIISARETSHVFESPRLLWAFRCLSFEENQKKMYPVKKMPQNSILKSIISIAVDPMYIQMCFSFLLLQLSSQWC